MCLCACMCVCARAHAMKCTYPKAFVIPPGSYNMGHHKQSIIIIINSKEVSKLVLYTQSNIMVISGREETARNDNYTYLGLVVERSGKLQCGTIAGAAGELLKAGDDDRLVLLHVLHE